MNLFSKIVVIFMLFHLNETNKSLKTLWKWGPGQLQYDWKNPALLKHLLCSNKYIPKNNVPLGMALHPLEAKIFITVPRWKPGVASSLNWIPIGTGNLDERLRPYPSWEANMIYSDKANQYYNLTNISDKLISVLRVYVDECNRLWAIDNGYDSQITNLTLLAPGKLLIYDLHTNKLLRKHTFSSKIFEPTNSSFGKIVVDVTPKTCDKAFAYITDVRYPGLVVYDYKKDKTYRMQHSFLRKEPLKDFFYSEGAKREADNNIDGICLSGLYKDGYRNLYVSAQSSNKQFVTSTRLVRNESNVGNLDLFYYLGERCSKCQSGGGQVIDQMTGVMIYNELYNSAISCWSGDLDNFSVATQQQLVVSSKLNYVSDIVITKNRELAAISCQLNDFFYSDNGVTTRVLVGKLDNLLKGTVCEPKCPKGTVCKPKCTK